MAKRAAVADTGKVHVTFYRDDQMGGELYGVLPNALPAVDAATWFLHTTDTMRYVTPRPCTGRSCVYCQIAA